MEGRHVDDVVEGAPSCCKRCLEIGERQTDLRFEIKLGRTVGAAPDLTRNKQQIARADRCGIAMLLIERVAVLGENSFTHEVVPSLVPRLQQRHDCAFGRAPMLNFSDLADRGRRR
jgi:hypothetical protein